MPRKGTGKANRFSELLNEEIKVLMTRQSQTLVSMEEQTGIRRNRLSKSVYTSESPLNTNELDQLCKALGAKPSEVVRRAERALQYESFALAAYRSDEPKGADEIFE